MGDLVSTNFDGFKVIIPLDNTVGRCCRVGSGQSFFYQIFLKQQDPCKSLQMCKW